MACLYQYRFSIQRLRQVKKEHIINKVWSSQCFICSDSSVNKHFMSYINLFTVNKLFEFAVECIPAIRNIAEIIEVQILTCITAVAELKIKSFMDTCGVVFHPSLCFKWNSFFSLAWFSWNPQKMEDKKMLTRKANIN